MLRGGSRFNSESKFRFKTLGFYFEPEIVTFEPHRMLVWSAKGAMLVPPAMAIELFRYRGAPRKGGTLRIRFLFMSAVILPSEQ